nr:ankyrin repeat-containing protein NPR4-like isoform X3 [Ipomoea batatas]
MVCMHAVDDLEAGNYVAEEDSFSNYMTLHRATVHGKWEEAKTFLEYNNLAIQAPISFRKNTTLHDAAKAGNKDFMDKVVAMMGDNNEVVGVVKNRDGLTALHIAARFGNKEAGEILVGKNRNLLYERCKRGLLPIHYAACNTLRKPEVFSYFLSVTKNDEDPEVDPYAGPTGATILVNLIKSKFYVMAWKLAHEYPDLARHRTLNNETSPLEAIVKYDYPIFKPKEVAMLNLKLEAVMLVKCLCDKLKIRNETQVASLAKEAIIQAAYLDIEEVVKNIVEACPNTAYYKDKNGRNILHIAIENHSTNVFKYVRGNSMLMHDLVDERDKNGNNIVHLAGKLTPPHKLNVNAALQMQQDLQWVKEVQKIAPAYFSSMRNKDEKTPKMVFTDEHKELRKEGEKWMKDTATACSVVAALIVTVMFAASITVPGGNSDGVLTQGFNGTIVAMGSNNNNVVPNMINGTIKGPIDETPPDEGLPVFRRRRAFKIFYVHNVDDLEAGNYVAEQDYSSNYLTLHRATVHGKWEEAQKFLEDNNHAIQAPIGIHKNTALHDAAKAGHKDFMEKAVEMMGDNNTNSKEVGVVKNRDGLTALHIAAQFGNKEVGEILVGKNPNLLYQRCNRGLLPIHYAAFNTRRSPEVFRYFRGVTKEDPKVNPYEGPSGATILVNLIKSKFYVVAMDLANEYPDLARHRTLDNETSPLEAIVKYDYPIIKDKEALMLVECLCDKLKTLNGTQVASLAKEAIIHAAYLDIEEVVKNIVEAYPIAAYYKDKSGRNILHIAIENRSTNVFNFVRENSMLMHDLVDERDNDGNNIMHLAGKLTPTHELNVNAALQMQQELQWVKEVQKIARPHFSLLRNKDEKTPKMVFRDEHKELRKEGEKWMKDTATACSIVATLIVTVVFAAAITVPGGNSDGVLIQGFNATINNNASINGTIIGPIDETPPKEGLPVFSKRRSFIIFYITNGVSLILSVSSLLIFLSIITSHYGERDFLTTLPIGLIIGLITLVFSVFFMIASFSATIYLVFGTVLPVDEKKDTKSRNWKSTNKVTGTAGTTLSTINTIRKALYLSANTRNTAVEKDTIKDSMESMRVMRPKINLVGRAFRKAVSA